MLDFLSTLFQSLSPLWEMSVTAAYAAAIVIVLRLLLKRRAPKQVLCLLWLVVFARLLIPVSLESPLSIVPDALPRQEQSNYLPNQSAGAENPVTHIQPQSPAQDSTQNQPVNNPITPVTGSPAAPALTVPEGVTPEASQPKAPALWQAALAGVWLAGAAALTLYALVSYLRLRRCLFDAIRAKDGAWEHPAVNSPFILGLVRPRIYLPAGLAGQPRQFILCHERAHLRRLDHIVKPICWTALALHWFNPMVWAAYILMSWDIEAACDEAVIRKLGPRVKADYSATLLALATNGRIPAPCPLAFDEGDAKGRIKNVLRYRRPALWVIVVSVIAAVLAAVCLLTDPVAAKAPDAGPAAGSAAGSSPSASTSQPPETLADTLLDPWMKEILDGERTFTPGGDGEFNINQLRAMVYGDEQTFELAVGRLAIIDLDRDGINEMVAWPVCDPDTRDDPTEIGYSTGYFTFRRQGDTVNVHYLGWRPMQELKADGTFTWSSSAFNWGTGSARFDENGLFEIQQITWCDNYSEDDENYFVDGIKAAREEFYAAYDVQNAKLEPNWYTYAGGVLSPWHPDNLELLSQTDPSIDTGEAKLWLDDAEIPWLEWNGATVQTVCRFTKAQSPGISCRDFDGDGENEVIVSYYLNGFLQLYLYEWEGNQPSFTAAYDTQQLLLRFNQNNVAAYNKDTRELSVTYSHTEGSMDGEDFYRHYVTGHRTLPVDFFDGYEHIRDGYLHAYANQFRLSYLDSDTNTFCFDFTFYLADETMQELTYVDIPSAMAPQPWYADHYIIGKPVGTTGFTVSYDGTGWQVREADALSMDAQSRVGQTTDITTAAPLDAPLTTNDTPEDRNEWYKVAELPDDMIWLFTRNYGLETLIRWDGNFYHVFDHTVHTARCIMPVMQKLGNDANQYGPLAVISNVGNGTGVSIYELVVYDLDAPDPVDYTHDWKPLRDDFNNNRTFQYSASAHTLTCTYQGQSIVLALDVADDDYRRITQEGIDLCVTGELVFYRFNPDNTIQIEFPLQVYIGSDVLDAPLVWPWFLRWTIRFNGSGFDTVPGSCTLFSYVN